MLYPGNAALIPQNEKEEKNESVQGIRFFSSFIYIQ